MTPNDIVIKYLTDRIVYLEKQVQPEIERANRNERIWEERYHKLLEQVGLLLSFVNFEFTPQERAKDARSFYTPFPSDLIEPCVLAGSPSKCCAKCGKGYKATITKKKNERHRKNAAGEYIIGSGRGGNKGINTAAGVAVTIHGYGADCECKTTEYTPATVIDPFGGSGTTAQVAISHGRNAILCEINEKYIELAHKRIKGTQINMPL